jgi:hypothetical protein
MSNTLTISTGSRVTSDGDTIPSEHDRSRFLKLYDREEDISIVSFFDVLKDLGLYIGGDSGVFEEAGEYLADNPGAKIEISYDEDGIVNEMKIFPPPNATEEQIAEADAINEELANTILDIKRSVGVNTSFSVRLNQDFGLQLTFQDRANKEAEGSGEKKTTVITVSKSSAEDDKQNSSDGTWVISSTTSSTTSSAKGSETSANSVPVVEPSAV